MTMKATLDSPWILRPRVRPGAKVRLFAFPYSGASASIFFSWAEPLPRTIELVAVQLPGRGARLSEPSFTHMTELIDALALAMLPFLDRPFALFGHSLGAVIAFELTRRLRATGANLPVHLLVSGHTAPKIEDRRPPSTPCPTIVLCRN